MDEEKRAQLFVDLYKQQMEHYQHTQTVEWKGNFGIWTLLAGAIYLAQQKSPSIDPLYACGVLAIAPLLHFLWLLMVLRSEQFDKTLWVRYRKEAVEILRGRPALLDETVSERGKLRTCIWLVCEVGVTVALCIALVLVAAFR
jgi:hypothetical protein